MNDKTIHLDIGSGGRTMHEFIHNCIIHKLENHILCKLDDSAVLENQQNNRIAITTDSSVVHPLFFPGGDIGRLAVSGTVNDLSTSGAKPYALSLGFILEEGVSLECIEKVIDSIAKTAMEADVKVVTGDTKVVERGKGDGIYINTSGIGFIDDSINLSTHHARENDMVMVTGPIGNHEIALLTVRENLGFEASIKSDVAPLNMQTQKLLSLTNAIHCIKDPTRGGVASALNEIAHHSSCDIHIDEENIPIDNDVRSICDLVGFDPLYLANEGKFLIICEREAISFVQEAFGKKACVIGKIKNTTSPSVILNTRSGGMRRLGMLEHIQLPRIC